MDEINIAILNYLDGTIKKFEMVGVLTEVHLPMNLSEGEYDLDNLPLPFRVFKLSPIINPDGSYTYNEVDLEGRPFPE